MTKLKNVLKKIQSKGGIISEPKTNQKDLLKIDAEVPEQNYFVFSYILSKDSDIPMMFKCRGTYPKLEQAKTRAEELRKKDKHFHIYIGEVGKWTSCFSEAGFEKVNINKNYAEEEMNKIMKGYQEANEASKLQHIKRREIAQSRANTLEYIQRILNFLHQKDLLEGETESTSSSSSESFDWDTLKFNHTDTDTYFNTLMKEKKFKNVTELTEYLNDTKTELHKLNQQYSDDFKLNVTDLEKTISELQERLSFLKNLN